MKIDFSELEPKEIYKIMSNENHSKTYSLDSYPK